MQEKIGNIVINLNFYSGKDFYSDGDIEDEILNIVKTNSEFMNILAKDIRWPILYHLSPQRRNLLEWYNFNKRCNLLEIGAGCGALTGLFCEKVDRVVAVELSRRRAEIIAQRHKDKSNLEIIVGNFNDIKLDEKFDYITLIGVLEYAAQYTQSGKPHGDFLKKINNCLKPGGVVIIAIENRFGLKYWAGAGEDHSGKIFDSLEDYIDTEGVVTFSKDELTKLLQDAGYTRVEFFYPVPDYKMPKQLFSDDKLPFSGELGLIGTCFPAYDKERVTLFNEKLVYNNLIKNNKFDFFANSFLLFCRT